MAICAIFVILTISGTQKIGNFYVMILNKMRSEYLCSCALCNIPDTLWRHEHGSYQMFSPEERDLGTRD